MDTLKLDAPTILNLDIKPQDNHTMNKKNSSLSPRQKELFEFIESTSHKEHRMPSLREMAKALKVSAVGTVQDHIKILIEKGFLIKDQKSLKVSPSRTCSMVTIPVVGTISAGTLTDAFEVALGTVAFSPSQNIKDTSKLLALRVSGESMIDAGILPGDIAIIDRSRTAKSGDIVVATQNDQATIKELKITSSSKTPQNIELIPHNKKFNTIKVKPSEEFSIIGPVIAVQRYF